MQGPFYVKDKDFFDQNVYKLAEYCKECAFGDKDFCALNNCIYFDFTPFDDEHKEDE